MANLFDVANYPAQEPAQVVAGDLWGWKRTDLSGDYPVASYTLSYEFRKFGAPSIKQTITATDDGTDFIVTVTSANSALWAPGKYSADVFITRNSDSARIKLESYTLEVKPDDTVLAKFFTLKTTEV